MGRGGCHWSQKFLTGRRDARINLSETAVTARGANEHERKTKHERGPRNISTPSIILTNTFLECNLKGETVFICVNRNFIWWMR